MDKQDTRQRLMYALIIIEDELWTTKDLKKMSNTLCDAYKHAVQKEIPHTLATDFCGDICVFKPVIWVTGSLPEICYV